MLLLFWLAFIIGVPIALAWFSQTVAAVLVTVTLIAGFPVWLVWAMRR